MTALPLCLSHAQQCSQLVREKEQCGREVEGLRAKMEVLQRTVEQQQTRLAAKVGPTLNGEGHVGGVQMCSRLPVQW